VFRERWILVRSLQKISVIAVRRDLVYHCSMKNKKQLMTQFIYEKAWTKVSDSEAIRLIDDEMKMGDGKGTLAYLKSAGAKGKVITVGECRFKLV